MKLGLVCQSKSMGGVNSQLPETKFFMSGAVYDVDVEVDESDGVWKIKNLRVNVKWTEGDPAVVGR